jgi:dienelactone hydrolase
MVEFDHRHMYSQPLREATTAWFDRWLKGVETEVHEPPIQTEPEAALACTPTGLVLTSLGGKRVFDFNREEASHLLQALEARRRDPSFRGQSVSMIRARLGVSSDQPPPRAQKVGEIDLDDLRVEKLALHTEPGIIIPARLIYPHAGAKPMPAVIYLRDRKGERDHPRLFATLARQGRVVAVADVRGFGETVSPRNVPEAGVDYFDPRDGMDADFTYASYFLGRPLLGMRVWDALGVVQYLRSRPDVDAKGVGVVGRGWAGTIALFAAAAAPQIAWAAVEGVPASFGEIARSELYAQPVSQMLPGVLQDFDMVDVMGGVAPRPLLVMNPTDPLVRTMHRAEAEQTLEWARKTYRAAGAAANFEARVVPLESELEETLAKWIAAR